MTSQRPIGTNEESLTFLVDIIDDEQDDTSSSTKGIFNRRETPALRQISVAILRENLHRTVNDLGHLFRKLETPEDSMVLKEVEVSFEVTASGRIAILGSSAEAAGKGAITIRFERTDTHE
jgi:hypothetical protein